MQAMLYLHLDFDLELAKKKSNENPVYYVQYAHARLCSIQRKVENHEDLIPDTAIQLEEEERQLLLHICRCHDDIYSATMNYQPYQMARYATLLARQFHSFYQSCPILKASDDEKAKRLKILGLAQEALQLVLGLLGVEAPNSM